MSELDRLSFSYPDNLKDTLEQEAYKELRTLPSYIKRILNAHLEKMEKIEEKEKENT